MTDDICNQDFKNCPYRVYDLEKEYPLCNYFQLYTRLIIDGKFSRIPSLIRRACKWIQKEEARLECIRKITRKKTLDFLKKAQVGDIVFCRIGRYSAVKLLEKPLDDSEFVSCQTPIGKTIRVQACHLSRISKGNYSGEFFIKNIENNEKAQEIEYKARYYGFRTELEKKDDGFLLKIYGDSQQEVDDFINLSLEQDFDISPYI